VVLDDRQAADLRASKIVGEAHSRLARVLAEDRNRNVALVFQGALRETVLALATGLVAIYSELQAATNPTIRNELVTAIKDRVTAFLTSSIASRPAIPGSMLLRLRGELIAHLDIVIPRDFDLEVHRRAGTRESAAAASTPKYAIAEVLSALWVLESEEQSQQGTAFDLEGYAVVTCGHVLHADTMAFRATDVSRRYPISVRARNDVLDVAVIQVIGSSIGGSVLKRGSADSLKQMDPLLVAGFPNYRLGDSGVAIPGLVIGFRQVSTVKRIITNVPIVAGNSGGPVLDASSRVVGIAVTGSDSYETAAATENHGIIPIDVLALLQAPSG